MGPWEIWFLTDSGLPTGGFARSHGLETLVEEGRVRTVADLRWLLPRLLEEGAATEGVACWHVLRARPERRVAAAEGASRRLARLPLPEEVRQASRAQGRRLLRLARSWGWDVPPVAGDVWAGPAWGLVAAGRGWDPETAVAAYLFTLGQEVVSAWCRLVRGDPAAAYGELLAVGPELARWVRAADRPVGAIATTSWWLEIVRGRHAAQEMRLFRT